MLYKQNVHSALCMQVASWGRSAQSPLETGLHMGLKCALTCSARLLCAKERRGMHSLAQALLL